MKSFEQKMRRCEAKDACAEAGWVEYAKGALLACYGLDNRALMARRDLLIHLDMMLTDAMQRRNCQAVLMEDCRAEVEWSKI